MARPLRIEYPGALYHVTSRGNARQTICLDDEDNKTFLKLLCQCVKRRNLLLHGYCLMGNHYHLILETPEGNLSQGMRQLNGTYTQAFNRRHGRSGHLLQGRYKAILVDKDNYLLELCRYVVLNPVRAAMVKGPSQWKWSSYRALSGKEKPLECLSTDWILQQFGNNRSLAQKGYMEFVREGVKSGSPWGALSDGGVVLGKEGFIEAVKIIIKGKANLQEVPRAQRYAGRKPLNSLLVKKGKHDDMGVYEAYVEHGYRMNQIAEYLGVHYSTVSRAIKRVEAK